ncbi:serine/threonine-protein kinase haspin homolog [Phlebotomus argentipes]|uniref:serine/threonine-protein kinase haspin homolog n=1 Tax=Phlebotomus argentipes TaxID=94469 RepID=UPI0028929826|nr:serine/threonine-protein kinase haspin homolog [Phlebotomus argentipes]
MHLNLVEEAILVPQSDDETYQSTEGSRDIRPSRHFSISRSLSAVDSGKLSFDESSSRKQFRRQTHSILRYRRTSSVREEVGSYINGDLTHRGLVLRYCGQSEPLDFNEVYSESVLRNCRKVGEGVYSEVFMFKDLHGRPIVLKVIPIEGDKLVNGEVQKRFEEIISEIVITAELSKLKNGQEYRTAGFVDLVNVRCVQGSYPEHLVDLWELYRDNQGTDNDHPEIFDHDQLYIVLELGNGGQDLEAFNFKNALEAYSAFIQVALSLAVAEQKYEFEHRDLHWGNILLSKTDDKEIEFLFNGEIIAIPSHGVRVTIIDYTLSRMVYAGQCQYNDLAQDEELFSASGDYQFDIYRLMRNQVENQWEKHDAFNNVLWLHYLVDKMINGAKYKLKHSKKHRDAIEEMMVLRDDLLDFKSASDYAQMLK